jgi:predicted exporter
MKRQGMAAVALWVALLVVCVVVISRASFTADLSAFLPRADRRAASRSSTS